MIYHRLNVTINDVAPGTFSYSPIDMDLTLNQAMTPNSISWWRNSTSWEIRTTGLNFGRVMELLGTPTALQTNPITYTIWANNSGGSTSTTVTITITDIIPSISYSLNDIIETLATWSHWEISPVRDHSIQWSHSRGTLD